MVIGMCKLITNVINLTYCILPVNSCGYYKFQVEIGVATKILILKLCVKYKYIVSTLNYTTTIRVQRLSEAQLLTGKIWYYDQSIMHIEDHVIQGAYMSS